MQLTSFIVCRKHLLNIGALLLMMSIGNIVVAEPLTYSPDQWPRHWNILINETHIDDQMNSRRFNGRYNNQAPLRSTVWGVVPMVKHKPRRSVRPEYDTNSHMHNYYSQGVYSRNIYPGFHGYALPNTFGVPVMNPYGVSAIPPGLAAPGLATPGIPFGTYPYVTPSPLMGGYPYMGAVPGLGYMW